MREKSDDIDDPNENSASAFPLRWLSDEENNPKVKSGFVKYAIIKTTTKKIPVEITQYAGWEKTLRKLRNIVTQTFFFKVCIEK